MTGHQLHLVGQLDVFDGLAAAEDSSAAAAAAGPILAAADQIRQDIERYPQSPAYYCYGYAWPAAARVLAARPAPWSSGWLQYVDAAAVRHLTRGEGASS